MGFSAWRKIFLFFLQGFLFIIPGQGQSYVKLNSFTTNEGLASNHIYDIQEDDKGFLWIATDNGLSRFDGKYFQNFSVKNGLPSNDVLQVLKEKDGTIWANSYKQLPAYFDEVSNQFIVYKGNEILNKISRSFLLTVVLHDGTIMFHNSAGSVTFKNKKIVAASFSKESVSVNRLINSNNEELSLAGYYVLRDGKSGLKIFILQKDKRVDSFTMRATQNVQPSLVNDNQAYVFTETNKMVRISGLKISPLRYTLDSLSIPENFSGYKFSGQYLNITSEKGTIYIFDKKSLSLKYTVKTDMRTNCAYVDRYNNLWTGTLDKGLLYYTANGISSFNIPANFVNNNFLSLAFNNKGEIFAGNFYSQVLHTNGKLYQKNDIPGNSATKWVRKIICINKKVIAISDIECTVDFKQRIQLYNKSNLPTSLKTAIALNDSIVIIGSIQGLIKLNINSARGTTLNSIEDRALSLAKFSDNIIYYTGPKGLYKHFVDIDSSYYIPLHRDSEEDRLSLLSLKDDCLWISTISGSLLAVKNDSIIATIPGHSGLPENITCLLPYKNQIWIGSKTGITVADYAFKGPVLKYFIRNISKTDGLPSNTINDLACYNDTIYAATENGIAIIPGNFVHPKYEISPQLISVKINQVNMPVSHNYELKSDQKNITLGFSGIELSGHFKNIQYSTDNENAWQDLTDNRLSIQLPSGHHVLYVRAKDVNDNASTDILKIHISIATPFYQARWFWILAAAAVTAIILRLYNRRKLAKQKTAFQQQSALEQQRNKITADLHDDIGASLSSLQVNSVVANQLINKDINQTKQVLEKIETQSKNLADKIGDIIWSMKPGKDEFMTMSSRIRNFANDILGATNMEYHIQVDKDVDTVIKDITARKNIVLITKEAINNAVKYSKASEIKISLKKEQQQFILIIADNGRGFDINKVAGNGIANMRKRAAEIKGKFEINSIDTGGTTITVFIPVL